MSLIQFNIGTKTDLIKYYGVEVKPRHRVVGFEICTLHAH